MFLTNSKANGGPYHQQQNGGSHVTERCGKNQFFIKIIQQLLKKKKVSHKTATVLTDSAWINKCMLTCSKMSTAPCIPRRSPIQVLTWLNVA